MKFLKTPYFLIVEKSLVLGFKSTLMYQFSPKVKVGLNAEYLKADFKYTTTLDYLEAQGSMGPFQDRINFRTFLVGFLCQYDLYSKA